MADGGQFEQAEWVWSPCAGAAAYRRSMPDDIGLFDEDFFAYMEDIDLSFRAQLLDISAFMLLLQLFITKLVPHLGDIVRSAYIGLTVITGMY